MMPQLISCSCILRQLKLSPSSMQLASHVTFSARKFSDSAPGEAKVDSYDLVINGGGIVGFSLLAALNSNTYLQDKKILLLEQQPFRGVKDVNPNPEDKIIAERKLSNRVTSLTISSRKFLEQLNVWQGIEPLTKACKTMYIWNDNYDQGITFSPRYPGLSDLTCPAIESSVNMDEVVCYFLENHVLLEALEKIVPQERVKYGSTVTSISGHDETIDLSLDGSDTTIRTKLLVGCDGFNSIVRSKSSLKYFNRDLKSKGLVGTVEMLPDSEFDENDVAFQRFVDDGRGTIVALLPLTNNYSSIVISTSNEEAEQLLKLSDEEFVDHLNDLLVRTSTSQGIKPMLKSAVDNFIKNQVPKSLLPEPEMPPKMNIPMVTSVVPKSRAAFPLFFGTTIPNMVGSATGSKKENLVLIGDSCHRIPPLAGQGLNLGIGDAIELAACLSEPLERGDDIFKNDEAMRKSLSTFERNRQLKLAPMMAAVASMSTVFSCVPSSLLSNFNHLATIKNEIVKFANSR